MARYGLCTLANDLDSTLSIYSTCACRPTSTYGTVSILSFELQYTALAISYFYSPFLLCKLDFEAITKSPDPGLST